MEKKILKILHFLKHPTCLIPSSGYLENFETSTFYYLNVQIYGFENECREGARNILQVRKENMYWLFNT